jgi:hypothetical protein
MAWLCRDDRVAGVRERKPEVKAVDLRVMLPAQDTGPFSGTADRSGDGSKWLDEALLIVPVVV